MKQKARLILTGIRMQLQLALVVPVDFMLTTVLIPTFYTFVFLLLLKFTGRLESLAAFGIIAPAMIGMWQTALMVTGEIIAGERWNGTLELLTIAPNRGMRYVIIGRILGVTIISLSSIVEAMLVARLGFGIQVTIQQPLAFLVLLLLAALSISAASLIMASTFVLSRSVRIFQNLLSFPFYLLGGLAFPITILPGWMQPFSRVVSLSWASEGLRQSMTTIPLTPAPFIALIILSALYALSGSYLLARIEQRIRWDGSLSQY